MEPTKEKVLSIQQRYLEKFNWKISEDDVKELIRIASSEKE